MKPSRWLVVPFALAISACGDDGGAGDDSTTGTGDGTPTTSGMTTMSATTSGPQTTDATGSSGAAESSSGGAGSTGADSSGGEMTGSGSGSGTDTGDSGSSSGGVAQECPPADILDAIDQHAHDLVTTAGLLAGHPSAAETIGFLLAPALPGPPASSAMFFGPLIMPCSMPLTYDAYCADGLCSQIECTGSGASWIMHFWLAAPPFAAGGWTYDDVTVDVAWTDGDPGVTFDIAVVSTAPGGEDMAMTGSGAMDPAGMTVTEIFPALDAAGPATLEYTDGAAFSGQLTIAGTVTATVDAAGHLVPTGDCP